MGNNSKTDPKVLESGTAAPVQCREGLFSYNAVGTGQKISVSVSFQVLNQVSDEDEAIDISIELAHHIDKVLVGMHKLTPKSAKQTYSKSPGRFLSEFVEAT